MSSALNRNLLLRDIIVECAPDDVGSPSLHGLSLVISDIEGGEFDLAEISETKWKHSGVVEMPSLLSELIITAHSTDAGDIGRVIFTKSDWNKIRDTGPTETYLKGQFDTKDLNLSLLLHLRMGRSVSDRVSGSSSATGKNSAIQHASALQLLHGHDGSPSAARLEDQFLKAFKTTRSDKEIRKAIEAYEQSADLPEDDASGMSPCLVEVCVAYQRRYDKFGKPEDLQGAITTGQKAISMADVGHEVFPYLLNELGKLFSLRFESSEDLDDIAEAIKNHQHAILLTPDGHAELPVRLGELGISFFHRFEYSGDLDDISQAIKNQQHAVKLTPDGHADLPTQLDNLGNSLKNRFKLVGHLDDISEAVRNQQRALELIPDGHADLPAQLSSLGNSLSLRFENTGNVGDISEAIKIQQQAVELIPDDLPVYLSNLGQSLSLRFEHSRDLDDISKAIKYQLRCIKLTPRGHTDLPVYLSDIGTSFSRRFELSGDLDDISKAIKYQQRGIKLTPDGHPDLPASLSDIGTSLLRRFSHNGNLGDMSQAIKQQRSGIDLTPDGDPDFPIQLSLLGNSLTSRFEHSGDLIDISDAIKIHYRAVELTPDGNVDLPTRLGNLGNSLKCRFDHSGDLDDISEAIKIQHRALELTPDGHVDLPTQLGSLGKSLTCRFIHTGHLDDISQAISYQRNAIKLTPAGHADLPLWLGSLGDSLGRRFDRGGHLDDISEAIKSQQRAIELTPDKHADLPAHLSNHGALLSIRFTHNGDLDDISEAIRNHQRAIQLTPDGHAEIPVRLSYLGISFLRRFEHSGNPEDIDDAIKIQYRAVELTPDGHIELPTRLSNVGNSLTSRFEESGDLDDISQAIDHHQRALKLTPDGHAGLPAQLDNLGNSLACRFEYSRNLDDISEAIMHQQRAIELTSDGHADFPIFVNNLGISFLSRFEHTGAMDDLSEAIENQRRALKLTPDGHADFPTRLSNLASSYFRYFKSTGDLEFLEKSLSNYRRAATSLTGSPSLRLDAAQRWAECLQDSPFSSSQLLDAYACIIQLLSLVSGLENTIQRRHKTLANVSQLSISAAAAALSLDRPDKAIEWLVEGRCIVWNQINQLRSPLTELRAHDRALADRLFLVSRELENAGSHSKSRGLQNALSMDEKISLEEQAGRHIKLAKERDQLLATIRRIVEFEDFLQPRKCADILRRLPDKGVIVVINIHDDRCDALALTAGSNKPMHIPLPKFSCHEAERLAKGLRGHLLRHGIIWRIGMPLHNPPLPDIDLANVLGVLWLQVVWPILDSLAFNVPGNGSETSVKLPRIWWCPTGPLAFLPIHAAGNYSQREDMPKGCLSEFIVSSYITTVNALLKTSASKSVEAPTGLLIVSQPNTPKKASIPYAAEEARRIARQLENKRISSVVLGDQNGTVKSVLKAMESFSSIHLACHASQDTISPLKSSVYLHDGPLELSEILKKNLPYADFAFLSACQTSMGDRDLSEEVVHLAAGMLAAGYRSIVGTMWSISDTHAPDIAELFYESLLGDGESKIVGAGAGQALHQAIQHFREKFSDSPDLNSLLVWVPYIHIGV